MPVLQSLTGNAELPAYFPVFQKQLSAANARTPSPAWPKIDDAFSTTFQEILRGEKKPKVALDAASSTIDGLLKGGK
jgi:ABC-type glycerol-3-phosphate transport system substrate-binding protein